MKYIISRHQSVTIWFLQASCLVGLLEYGWTRIKFFGYNKKRKNSKLYPKVRGISLSGLFRLFEVIQELLIWICGGRLGKWREARSIRKDFRAEILWSIAVFLGSFHVRLFSVLGLFLQKSKAGLFQLKLLFFLHCLGSQRSKHRRKFRRKHSYVLPNYLHRQYLLSYCYSKE